MNNKKDWDPNGTYGLLSIANHHIKPEQINNLKNFSVISELPKNAIKLEHKQVLELLVDGLYNRGVEDFSYRKLYENCERRGGFDYQSASGIITFIRPDGTEVIVAGVHRCVFAAVKGIPIVVNRFIHKPDTSIKECRRIEAQVYTDEGYHLYKQTPDQAFKAAYVANESWAVDFAKTLKSLSLKVKGIGHNDGTNLTGYQTLIKTIDTYGKSSVIEAGNLLQDELEDENRLNSLLISGLSALVNKEQNLNDKYLKKAISSALISDSFLTRTQHGSAVQNIAVRFAKYYNGVAKRKSSSTIELVNLCNRLELDPTVLATDGVIVNA